MLLGAWLLNVDGHLPGDQRLAGDICLTWAMHLHRFVYDPLHSTVTVDGHPGTIEEIRRAISELEHSESEIAALATISHQAMLRLPLLPHRLAEMTAYAQSRRRVDQKWLTQHQD